MNVKYARKSVSLALAVIAVLVTAIIFAMPSYAESLSPGLYSVKVVPVYNNPDTGKAEDVGQNPGIGQMMVEAQVQNAGYIEVYEDGSMYLNTRWNLAEPTIYAGFATS